MAKNTKKKRKHNCSAAMVVTSDLTVADAHASQAMDTSESVVSNPLFCAPIRKTKGVAMKRSKNVRKMKATAKAISQNEKSVEKILKNESKTLRTKSAKKLYD